MTLAMEGLGRDFENTEPQESLMARELQLDVTKG